MFKSLLVSAALLLPGVVSASTSAFNGTSANVNMCYIIGADYYKCMQANRYCFWDTEDGRCEPLGAVSYCGRIFNPYQCQAQPGCFWDTEDGRCEQLN